MTPANPATILIIEDEAAIRQSFADYLEDMDFRILTAENGRIGLEIFERDTVDLVLVDLRMPEVDGLEVLARIRDSSPSTPMIVVSGTGIIGDAVEALRQGAWDYLLKPIEDLSVLYHAVTNTLEKARLKQENREYQQHLERMVADRTKELQEANDHLSQINERLRRIVNTTRSLSFCAEVKNFGALLLEEFGQHMLATGGSLYLKEKEGMRLMHTLDPGHAPLFLPFPFAEGTVFHLVLSQKQPVLIPDITADTRFVTSGWEGYRNGSALVFPLPDDSGEITGILTLHSKTPPPFVDQDKEIGTILASYSCEALRAVRATEELRESEQQFRGILDTILTGIVIVAADTLEIVYANPTAAAIIGIAAADIIGRNCHEVLCPDEHGPCPVLHFGKKIDSSERQLKTNDGRYIPIFKTVTRTTYQGKECLLESFIDLTAQKQAAAEKAKLESQLRQVQKMEALGTLAGGIAHDFNNILSAVIGYAELGFMDLNDHGHPLHGKLNSILHAGNRAKDLVAQILAFSRMQEQMLTPIKIAPIAKEALKLLQASLPADIELKTRIDSQDQVLADPTQIHQVVMNLCTNAYHAMAKTGGMLSVSLASLTPDAIAAMPRVDLSPGRYLRLTVADTGCGINPSDMDRIFDPYFSTKDKDKGTGLGLAVVHGIVKSHGGAISVKSQLDEGTTFEVLLPVTEETGNAETEQLTVLPRGTEKILFVDDEKDLVDIGHQMLEMLGYDVTGVVGSSEALTAFIDAPQQFDLVVTDLNMPGLTGDRLAQKLIAIRPDLPVILCSGFSERINQNRARATGIRKFIMKPLAMNVLAETIRDVLDTRNDPAPR